MCWCLIFVLNLCTVAVNIPPLANLSIFSDANHAFPGGLLKHTCPFSPTCLIAVGTLINPHVVCHLPCANPKH